jgi:hypothetical protein
MLYSVFYKAQTMFYYTVQHTQQAQQLANTMRSVKAANVNNATLALCATVTNTCKRCTHKKVCAVLYNAQLAYLQTALNS